MYCWVRASPSNSSGVPPQPRSGHTAVNIRQSKVAIFGGLVDKTFVSDITVYDIENKSWFQPECYGSGSDGRVGPCPRAFHVAIAIDCHMFIFGGRSGSKRLGDFWVLDTDIWQWSELTSLGDLPSARDFAAASSIGNSKIVLYGGWDGKKWLSDVFILDTISLEWTELSISGALPPPRCGHSATMVEKRLLVYGGRGGGGPIMGDLWALKGLIEGDSETPGWTQLKLPGQAPTPRCGHTVTSRGHNLLLFGGHGTGGWLSRYDIYYNDCIVLDRVSVQWRRLSTNNDPPDARAYHSMTSIGSRFLLFGGFDGKSTFGDLWWLVPEEDPIAKQVTSPSRHDTENEFVAVSRSQFPSEDNKESRRGESSVLELQKRLQLSVSLSNPKRMVDVAEDREFIELASQMVGGALDGKQATQVLREHWRNALPKSIQLKELGPLLRDYQRLVALSQKQNVESFLQLLDPGLLRKEIYRFYHIRDVHQLRMDDIPHLLEEYRQLPNVGVN
ncbi:hypothetical protein DM860_005523 [Cuscuta australis]|uniref:Uncharacterized protein n=1 Tax=Cuscuta australis TaxID=267555 RepID=A0A328DZP7_9ASTE|nr:hypothetical protein DM860_005523 [Cuscuta australis]